MARTALLVAALLTALSSSATAVEPGVDIAVPRVAVSITDDSLLFHPANLVVEQFDYVRWRFTGTSVCHTTTSGAICGSPSGLWNVTLGPSACPNNPQTVFTRQFAEAPGTIPYNCAPHCFLGMKGNVSITSLIDLTVTDSAGTPTLSWKGGGGLYRVIRSDAASFNTAGTTVLTPSSGMTLTTWSDSTTPAPGLAAYFLVMNQ